MALPSLTGSKIALIAKGCGGQAMNGPFNREALMLNGYRAWIRTMNNASKGRCVTVTPRGKKERATQYPQKIATRKLTCKDIARRQRFVSRKAPRTSGLDQPGAFGFQCLNAPRIWRSIRRLKNRNRCRRTCGSALPRPHGHAMTGFGNLLAKPVTQL
jgi:hypothetical protein